MAHKQPKKKRTALFDPDNIRVSLESQRKATQLAHNVITTLVKGCCKVRSNLTFTRRSYNITFLSGIRACGVNVGLTLKFNVPGCHTISS